MIGDEWPRRNLGTGEHWGRTVEGRLDLLSKGRGRLNQSQAGLGRYSAATSADLARIIDETSDLADSVEALLAQLPRYFTSSVSRTSYGAAETWTTVLTTSIPKPAGKTTCSLVVSGVASLYRPVEPSGPLFVWPFPLEYVTSEFGPRPPLPDHRGIDFSGGPAVLGAPIKAAADGVIIRNDYTEDDWGWYVRIGHDAVTGIPDNWTGYAHLNEQSTLPVGTPVTQGQTIGYLGDSGYSFGAHLHYETAVENVRINPRDFMSAFSGGGGGVTPETGARIVISGVPGNEFRAYSTRGFPGYIRQNHYLTGGSNLSPSGDILIELQVTGLSASFPEDPRNLASFTASGSWT